MIESAMNPIARLKMAAARVLVEGGLQLTLLEQPKPSLDQGEHQRRESRLEKNMRSLGVFRVTRQMLGRACVNSHGSVQRRCTP